MKIRFGSGPAIALLSIVAVPSVGSRKPPRMLSRVDLPQPEGPTRQMSSPSRTSREMSSSTWTGCAVLVFGWKVIHSLRTEILGRKAAGLGSRGVSRAGDGRGAVRIIFVPSSEQIGLDGVWAPNVVLVPQGRRTGTAA